MGVDVYLRSMMSEEAEIAILDRAFGRQTAKDFERASQEAYDALTATGDYFRDPYNRFGLLPVLGMDWLKDVAPFLSTDGKLSIEGARYLLAELEKRWVTQGAVDNAMLGAAGNPVLATMEKQGLVEAPKLSDDWSEVLPWLSAKRSQLIALLQRSIELNEPLECSL